MSKLSLLALCLVLTRTECSKKCDSLGVLLYEDLNCKPVTLEGEECPQQYHCDDFKTTDTTCMFRSRTFGFGEQIDNDLVYGACHVNCKCLKQYQTNKSDFTCAILDCPEWLGMIIKPGCYFNYTLGKCCTIGQICKPLDDTAKCQFEGKEFLEGNKFWPHDTCHNCVCQKGFEGKLEAPYCERINCALQVRNSEKLAKNCAPVYLSDGKKCCPDYWACPTETDVIKKINPEDGKDSNLICKFGDHDVKLGEGLNTQTLDLNNEMVKVTCECVLPPFLTCTKKA